MYIHMYIHVYIYIYICRRRDTHIHTYAHTYIHIYMYIQNIFISTHIVTCMHTCMHTCIQTYIHMCVHIFTHIYVCLHKRKWMSWANRPTHTHMSNIQVCPELGIHAEPGPSHKGRCVLLGFRVWYYRLQVTCSCGSVNYIQKTVWLFG